MTPHLSPVSRPRQFLRLAWMGRAPLARPASARRPEKRHRPALEALEARDLPGDVLPRLTPSALPGAKAAAPPALVQLQAAAAATPAAGLTGLAAAGPAVAGGPAAPRQARSAPQGDTPGNTPWGPSGTLAAAPLFTVSLGAEAWLGDPLGASPNVGWASPRPAFAPPDAPGGSAGQPGGGSGLSEAPSGPAPQTAAPPAPASSPAPDPLTAGLMTLPGPTTSFEPSAGGGKGFSLSAPVASPTSPDPASAGASALPASPVGQLANRASSPPAQGPTSPTRTSPGVTPSASPQAGPGLIAVGPDAGAAPTVKVYDAVSYKLKLTISAYASTFTGGVRVAVGDVNGDGTPDVITAPGPGGGSLVKVFSGVDGALLQSFNAYAPGQTDGAYVAAGDVNGDGKADIITGTDVGAKPLVKVFSGADDSLLSSFLSDPLAGPNGVRVAAGDLNGDGKADVITGAGPGGAPRVTAVDGATGKQFWDFFAYEDTFGGGVYVGAGDLDGDGRADVLTGPGSGAPWVHTYRGLDQRTLGNFLAYDGTFGGGVRVAALDPNGAGLDQAVTGPGSGGRELRVFSGQTFAQQASLFPYGGSFSAGMFVAASPGRGGGAPVQPFTLPTVTVTVDKPVVLEPSGASFTFTATRTGSTAQSLQVGYLLGGTATVGTDYQLSGGPFNFGPGQSTATQTAVVLDDGNFDTTSVAVLSLETSPNYNIGNPGSAQVEILDTPVTLPSDSCGCGGGGGAGEVIGRAAGLGTNPVSPFSAAGVDYFDGVLRTGGTDLSSGGFGVGWGLDRSWTNAISYDSYRLAGGGGVFSQLPYLLEDGYGHIGLISNGTTIRLFDATSPGVHYADRYNLGDDWYKTTDIAITDTLGQVLTFNDFNSGVQFGERAIFKSFKDAGGNLTSVTSWNGNLPAEVQRSSTVGGTTVVESYLYTYATGLLTHATLRRQVNGGAWATVRQADYTYAGVNLKLAVVQDAAGTALDTSYFRYYADGDANGYAGGLKYAFGPQSYARLVSALGSNVDSLSDAQVAPYADAYYQYDPEHRVTQATIQGAGCSACSGGLGTFSYSYTASAFADGQNNWRTKAVEALPDGNSNTVYTNYLGQVLLSAYQDAGSGLSWVSAYHYDTAYRLVEQDQPSAVASYNDGQANLAITLNASSGLIEDTDYGTSTTATSSTAGDVSGYYKDTKVQQGSGGTAILQDQTQYFSQTAGGITIYPTATQTAYRNTDGTGAESTSYAYTWFSGTNQAQSVTVSKPVVSAAQNGPGTTDVDTTFNDSYGRPIWHKDADGFIDYTEYDQATGAVSKAITDVDTTRTGDFMNLPAGWSTPSGGGLHLVTLMQVDGLGRTTKLTDPAGNITYTVYNDPNYEVRTYAGWNATTNTPTGPTLDSREDRPGSYTETLTMSATPHLTAGVPDGTEAVGNIQSLSRSYTNSAGQVVRGDDYFNLSGVTYSTAQYIGTQNTNYYTTLTAYDSRGRQNRVQRPTGTIERTVYDGLGRVASTWVGTNDTPGSGYWSPSNNTPPSNMVKTADYVYDNNTLGGATQVGDGDLTQVIAHPGGGAPDRVSETWYDWRDRAVATKDGVQATEDTATHRPITYTTYDNLGEATQVQRYDGDTVTITISGGVPQAPAANLLRAQTTTGYDDQGREYLTQVYSVNPGTGAVSSTALSTNTWYNHRGLVIKTSEPGGLVSKALYDGAGRVTKDYTTDGGGDASWADAGNVTGDAVLVQTESGYDADGNVTLPTTRQRFHDETATGELGNPTTAPKARVSYVASYYDLANRLTTTLDVGTNGGTAYTRPGTPPAASDTVLRTDTGYAADSVQQVQLTGGPTGGTFTLSFNGQTTAAIAYNASAAAVQSALQALSSVGSGNALVANPTGAAWVVRFAGTLAGAAQPALTGNGAGLTGGTSPSVAVTLTSLGGDAGRVQQTTDPRGLISKMDYDWLGRTVRTVEAFATFNPSNSADNTTEYSYDGSNHIITVQADLAGGAYEQTKYVYGVTTAGGSGLNSNDVLAAMQYPDPGTGNPSSTQQESYTANALGEQIGLTDRDGDVHAYLYDVLGRLTSDQVTTLGSGVDGTVRRLDTAYDTQGNAYLFTSYSTTAGTTVVNQVQRGYNGLGQLTTEYQEHGGAVNTSSSAKVQYTYSEMAGGANHSRLTSVVYPGTGTAAKTVNYNYAAGLDDRLSRLTSLSDSSATLESYSYLGLDTVVDRSHPQPGVDLTFIKQTGEANGDAGDQYTGLDRFGRVVDQRWLKVSTQVATDRFKYGYDRDSNRLYHDNLVNTAFGELYHANGAANGYDSLNQLGAFSRGVLSDTNADGVPDTVASAAHSQSWSYDALGNWTSFTSDASTQTRTANKQNEVTSISGQTTPGYDGNGNTTTDQAGNTLVYDAWNRLVAYKSGSTTLAAYGYDALGRRLSQTETGTTTDVYYSAAWQVLEERVGGTAKAQYVWGPVYVDALVERDRDADGNAGNGLEERLYAQQDANWNVTALLDTGGNVVERYAYDPFGAPTVLTPAWAVRGSSSYAWVYLHQGGRFDGVTGLYHFRSRDYSPALGRWLSQDPVKQLGGVNLYGYLAENPLHFTDAAGLAPLDQQIVGPKEVLGRIPGRIPFPVRGGVVAGMVARMIDQARDAFSENLQGVGLSKETADDIAAEVGGGDAALFYLVREFNPGSRGPGKDAFVYTCKCGWIDIGHFFWSAATTALLGKSAAAASWTLLAGYLIELHQALVKLGLAANHKDINDWAASAFTLEDLPSNSMGAVFALRVTSKTFRGAMGEIRTKLAAMFKACGAVDPANIIGIIGLGRFTARDFLERDARAYQEASFKKGFVPWRGIDPYNFFIFPVKTHSHDCVCDKAGNPINRRK